EGRRLAVVHADSRGDADRAAGEVVRLVTVNKVLAVLGGEPAAAGRLGGTVRPYNVPLVTPAPLATPAPQGGGGRSPDGPPEIRGEVLARFAGGVLQARRAALVADAERPPCAAAAAAFARHWRAGANRQLQAWNYDRDDKGERLAGRVREAKAQVFVFAGAARDFARARAALEAAKLSVPLVFAGEAEEWAALLADAEAGRGVYGAAPSSLKHLGDDGKKFVKRYRERHHEEPDLYALGGYEMVRVVAQGLRDTKGQGGARLREELGKERDFDGLTGKLTFDKGR